MLSNHQMIMNIIKNNSTCMDAHFSFLELDLFHFLCEDFVLIFNMDLLLCSFRLFLFLFAVFSSGTLHSLLNLCIPTVMYTFQDCSTMHAALIPHELHSLKPSKDSKNITKVAHHSPFRYRVGGKTCTR